MELKISRRTQQHFRKEGLSFWEIKKRMSTENAMETLEVAVVNSSKHDLPEYGTEQCCLDLRASIVKQYIESRRVQADSTGLKCLLVLSSG